MLGSEIRIQRMIPDGERIIILPVDHGEFQGPRKGLIQPMRVVEDLNGYDAILLSPGMLVRCGRVLARKRGVSIIARLNWNADYCFQWGYQDGTHARIVSPTGALIMGADAGLASVAFGSGVPATDARAAEMFGKLAEEARIAGLPLGAEVYPSRDPENCTADEFHDLVLRGCRMASELGADFVKTFYTGPRFAEVVEATPVPIIVLGGGKEDEASALRKAADGIAAGARGAVFGRNVFESDRPQAFLDALGAVVRERQDPAVAAQAYGFAV